MVPTPPDAHHLAYVFLDAALDAGPLAMPRLFADHLGLHPGAALSYDLVTGPHGTRCIVLTAPVTVSGPRIVPSEEPPVGEERTVGEDPTAGARGRPGGPGAQGPPPLWRSGSSLADFTLDDTDHCAHAWELAPRQPPPGLPSYLIFYCPLCTGALARMITLADEAPLASRTGQGDPPDWEEPV